MFSEYLHDYKLPCEAKRQLFPFVFAWNVTHMSTNLKKIPAATLKQHNQAKNIFFCLLGMSIICQHVDRLGLCFLKFKKGMLRICRLSEK